MRAVLVFAVAAVTGAAAAQGPSTFEIPRTSAAPVIDGRVDPAEWAGAARVEVDIEYQPADNRTADVRAEALIMEDGETLFVAFLAEDPDTGSIRAYFKDRDAIVVDDWMSVVLDTFNDERRAYAFTVNPLGVQADAIFDDVNGRLDDSWNGIWDSAGRIIESGYSVELAIPFKQLRFSDTDSVQTWGVDFVRRYPRDQVTMISSNPRDRDISCYLCQIAKADGFDNLERGRNLEIIPTVTASASKDRPSGQGDWLGADESEGGLDVRWGITPDMYLNATLNPDFSQVEADSPQLDVNNTFALFFPERRTFFLDGSDYFETRQNLVHTRTIAEPEYGAKLTGKSGAHTFGLLAANDRSTSFVIPGSLRSSTASLGDTPSDVAIGRYRADIFGNSTIGALVTDRQGSGYRNTVMSLDTTLRPTDQDTIAIQAMRSRSSYPGQIQRDFGQQADIAGDNLFVEYSHADRRWDWRVGYFDVGEDFRADLGFINRVDYKHVVTTVGHTWRWDGEGFFSRIRFAADWDRTEDQSGLKLEEETEFFLNMNGPMQSFLNGLFGGSKSWWNGQYFDEQFNQVQVGFSPSTDLTLGMRIRIEDVVDFANTRLGRSNRFGPQMRYQWGRHLQLDLEHTIQQFDVDGGRLFTARLTDLRSIWQFDARSALRFTLQHSDTERDRSLYTFPVQHLHRELTTQLLYSFKLNAATRFFIGYSDAGFRDDRYQSLVETNRTWFAKFSYAWLP